MIEDWLLKKDEYTPEEDKTKFIDKSILSITKILSKVRRKGYIYDSKVVYRINPVVKVAMTFISLILIALTRSYYHLLIMLAYSFILISTLDREDRKAVIGTSILVPMFTLVMLIPSIMGGNVRNSFLILSKIMIDILLVNSLAYTTSWNEITKSLKLFYVPDIFIWIMEITLKYIVLLGEHSLNLLYSLKIRSIGKNNGKQNSLSHIIGNLFLKSKHMGDEMFAAMECRGFVGEYKSLNKFKIGKYDFGFLAINIALIIVFLKTNYF